MPQKRPIYPDRIRKIRGSFSWIEHRFVHGSFLRELSRDELLLYYFLVTVGDKNGVSFYGYEKICRFLKMEVDAYLIARDRLIQRQMIAQRKGVFQVLPLPKQCLKAVPEKRYPDAIEDNSYAQTCQGRPEVPKPSSSCGIDAQKRAEGDFRSLAEIFKQLGENHDLD